MSENSNEITPISNNETMMTTVEGVKDLSNTSHFSPEIVVTDDEMMDFFNKAQQEIKIDIKDNTDLKSKIEECCYNYPLTYLSMQTRTSRKNMSIVLR